jgi:polyferredoxin
MKRRIVQTAAAIFLNPWLGNFLKGRIYQGSLKAFCVPGLNCYSCPAAFGACPVGTLQVSLASVRGSFAKTASVAAAAASLYAAGFVMLVGALGGRFACGWLCPFGYVQELLTFDRKRRTRLPRAARLAKYAVLVVMVVLLPLLLPSPSSPPFCKWVCPAGTLEAGLPLVGHARATGQQVYTTGALFAWKAAIACVVLVGVLFVSRFFCRTLCPLGAAWGLFNRVSLLAVTVDASRCTKCGFCRTVCPVDILIYEDPDSAECVRCFNCTRCPEGAVKVICRTAGRSADNSLAAAPAGEDISAVESRQIRESGEDR